MSSSGSEFAYTPLDRQQNEIRLVHLLPSTFPSNEINCKLIHTPLDGDQPYEALSYTWGSNEKTDNIILNDSSFFVTKNLYEALKALRTDRDRYLWIDAIAINQDDVLEKNHEVPRMLQIYQNAQRVVVWLGDGTDDSDLAIDHLHELSEAWQGAQIVTYTDYILDTIRSFTQALWKLVTTILSLIRTWIGPIPIGHMIVTWLYCKISQTQQRTQASVLIYLVGATASRYGLLDTRDPMHGLDPQKLKALRDIFDRPWFLRVWIVQEVAASRDTIVLCGLKSIPWVKLRQACDQIDQLVNSHPGRSPYLDTGHQVVGTLDFTRFHDVPDMPQSAIASDGDLLALLNRFYYFEATDPRDKVYALLGLCDDIKTNPFEVDYARPVEQVYADVARYLATSSNSLHVLAASLGNGMVAGLPSWVPDWTSKTGRAMCGLAAYRPPWSIPGLSEPIARFSDDNTVLSVQAIIVGRLVGDGIVLFNPEDFENLDNPFMFRVDWIIYFMSLLVPIFILFILFLNYTGLIDYAARHNTADLGWFFEYLKMAAWELRRRKRFAYPQTGPAFLKDLMVTGSVEISGRGFKIETVDRLFAGIVRHCNTLGQCTEGDLVCMIVGAKSPLVVRRTGDRYRMVGMANFENAFMNNLVWKEVVEKYEKGSEAFFVRELALC